MHIHDEKTKSIDLSSLSLSLSSLSLKESFIDIGITCVNTFASSIIRIIYININIISSLPT